MERTAFVTGATGFVGGRLAAELRARGWTVRALVRPATDGSFLVQTGVRIVPGDLADLRALSEGATGSDVVFHCAGAVGDRVAWDVGRATNHLGTQNVLRAAADAGARRVVHVSSVLVYGFDAGVFDEDAPRNPTGDPYADTKLAGEEACERMRAARRLEIDIVRPSIVYGPGDRGMLPQIIELMRQRKFPLLGGGRATVNLVHVDDVVHALVACGTTSRGGDTYNVAGAEETTWKDLLQEVAERSGIAAPARAIPMPVAYALAWSCEKAADLGLRLPLPPLSRNGVKFLTASRRYPTDKLRDGLGVASSIRLSDGLAAVRGQQLFAA